VGCKMTSMIISALSGLPGNLAVYLVIFFLVCAWLVWYALYKKGDVRAVVSHGKTVFALEAKERKSDRR
jgi:hypothetical protein